MVGVTRLLAGALAMLGLAACAAPGRPGPPAVAVTSTTTTAVDGIRDRTVPWEAGRLDADPRRVVVSWTGGDPAADPSDPCWVGYAPEVSAEPDRVVVRLRSYRSRVPLAPQQFCTDMGFVRTLTVRLHDDLGGRPVVDGHDGRRRRLAPVPLQPRWLPEGWRLVDEFGQGGTWERGYGPGPAAGGAARGGVGVSRVTVSDGPPSVGRTGLGGPGPAATGAGPAMEGRPRPRPERPRSGPRVIARPSVRGVTAAVERSPADGWMAVRWREGRRGLAVRATFPTDPSDRAVAAVRDLLVRIARSLR
jgi:hypothetical protein